MAALSQAINESLANGEPVSPDLFFVRVAGTRAIAIDTLGNGRRGKPLYLGYYDGSNPVIFRSLISKLELGLRISLRDRIAAVKAVSLRSSLD